MATSGSQNFTQTRDGIINDAFQLLGVYGIGRTVSAEDTTVASNALNRMIKAWGAKSLHLWEKTEGVLFTTVNTSEYSLGNAATDAYVADVSDTVVTQLDGSHAAAATAITVSDTTGMTASDIIGIVTTDLTTHWTTISSVDTSTTLTIASGLDTAASDDGLVYTFTSRLYKPLRVLDARLRQGFDSGSTSTQSEIVMTTVPYQSFFEQSDRTSGATPVQFSYTPGNTAGTMRLWPRPVDTRQRVHFTYERVIEDLDSASDDFDLPSEWLEPITWQLAVRLGPAFGRTQKALQLLPIASEMLDNLLEWDHEITELQMEPEYL